MLRLEGVSKSFGGVRAVDQLDLSVRRGELVGLIGPNGSGKTTTVNLITGLFAVSSGRIIADNNDITSLPTHRRGSKRVSRTFPNNPLFPHLSLWEKMLVGFSQNNHAPLSRGHFCGPQRDT